MADIARTFLDKNAETEGPPIYENPSKKDFENEIYYTTYRSFNHPIYGKVQLYKENSMNRVIMGIPIISTDKNEAAETIECLKIRENLNHPHLLHMLDYSCLPKIGLCSSDYNIKAFFDFPLTNLSKDVKERQTKSEYYHPEELTTLISQMLKVFSHLHGKGVFHGNVCPRTIQHRKATKNFVLLDHFGEKRTIEKFHQEQMILSDEVFLAPEVYRMVSDDFMNPNTIEVVSDFYKTDIFSFGMVILYLGVLKSIQDIYSGEGDISKEKLEAHISLFEQRYIQKCPFLVPFLKLMLTINPDNRPIINELQTSFKIGSASVGSQLFSVDSKDKSEFLPGDKKQTIKVNGDNNPLINFNGRVEKMPPRKVSKTPFPFTLKTEPKISDQNEKKKEEMFPLKNLNNQINQNNINLIGNGNRQNTPVIYKSNYDHNQSVVNQQGVLNPLLTDVSYVQRDISTPIKSIATLTQGQQPIKRSLMTDRKNQDRVHQVVNSPSIIQSNLNLPNNHLKNGMPMQNGDFFPNSQNVPTRLGTINEMNRRQSTQDRMFDLNFTNLINLPTEASQIIYAPRGDTHNSSPHKPPQINLYQQNKPLKLEDFNQRIHTNPSEIDKFKNPYYDLNQGNRLANSQSKSIQNYMSHGNSVQIPKINSPIWNPNQNDQFSHETYRNQRPDNNIRSNGQGVSHPPLNYNVVKTSRNEVRQPRDHSSNGLGMSRLEGYTNRPGTSMKAKPQQVLYSIPPNPFYSQRPVQDGHIRGSFI
jgi:hypothetical protein